MDPLSIAASVAGLLAIGGKLISIFSHISRLSDAPPICRTAVSEVCDVSAALRQVRAFLVGQMEVSAGGREQVLLEHLAASLTGCVMTKDELETIVDELDLVVTTDGLISGVFNRARWARREPEIQRLIQRLQNHKTSLNLMLTVLQCSTSMQIQDSLERLQSLMEQTLIENSTLYTRLSRLEDGSTSNHQLREQSDNSGSARTIISHRPVEGQPEKHYNDTSSIRIVVPHRPVASRRKEHKDDHSLVQLAMSRAAQFRLRKNVPQETARIPEIVRRSIENDCLFQDDEDVTHTFSFEQQLQASRVYRKLRLLAGDGHSMTSMTTGSRRRIAASLFSALSLADVSNLSLFSLPISVHEISNNRWYVQVGRTERMPLTSSYSLGGGSSHLPFTPLLVDELEIMHAWKWRGRVRYARREEQLVEARPLDIIALTPDFLMPLADPPQSTEI